MHRSAYKCGRLLPSRTAQLKSLGFRFFQLAERWEEGFAELVTFKKKFGHCKVKCSLETETGFKLGAWCYAQRLASKKGKLTENRISRLASLGFFEKGKDVDSWGEAVACLVEYKNIHQTCLVPVQFITPSGFRLGGWCASRRQDFKDGRLTEARVALLKTVGFVFDAHAFKWEQNYGSLCAFKDKYGHCLVKQFKRFGPWHKLQNWCAVQHVAQKAGILSSDRYSRLKMLGFFDCGTTDPTPKIQNKMGPSIDY